jgi:microcystin-dependent protein
MAHEEIQSYLKAMWPVGSIYISASGAFDPNTHFGGTWEAFGAGRVPVGQDAEQGEFDTLEEVGGEKTHVLTTAEMPSHTHVQDAHTHIQNAHTHVQDAHTHIQNSHSHTEKLQGGTTGATAGTNLMGSTATGGSLRNSAQSTDVATAVNQNATATNQNATATNQNATATNQSTGGGGAHNNLQPYIVVKMWKRTA